MALITYLTIDISAMIYILITYANTPQLNTFLSAGSF